MQLDLEEEKLAAPDIGVQELYSARELAARFAKQNLSVHGVSYRVLKRSFDLAVCILLLPIVGLTMLLVGLFVLLSSGRPVFYRQERVGQNGKMFKLLKFRTMRKDGAQLLSEWFVLHPEARKEWQKNHKLKLDPRVTRGGLFMRQTSLDELPQILNVLRGEMSLVGPRPVVEAELVKYGKRVGFYLAAVPGLTGLWQVSGRCNVSYEQRVRMDEEYVRSWSLWKDIQILFRTPLSVIRRDGAC